MKPDRPPPHIHCDPDIWTLASPGGRGEGILGLGYLITAGGYFTEKGGVNQLSYTYI